MKITNALATVAAAAAAGAIGFIGTPIAAADDLTTTTIGNEARLTNGNVVQGWTITDLKASTDQIPYPVAGTLWEATATDQAIEGSVTPIVSNLNARAKSGETYRVLFGVASPQGVNPATLAQGQRTTGKVYFDVVGDTPDSVVYNAGGQDLLAWVQPPPQLPTQRGGGSYSSSPASSATPATPAAVPGAPIGVEAVPAPGAVLPAGSAGTPIPAGSQGTPIAGSQGTPVPGTTPMTPAPLGTEGAPQPASVQEGTAPTGSQGTPLPAGAPAAAGTPAVAATPAPATAPAAPSTTVIVPPPA
ncbi:MPT63 family protein [Mycobacterium sp. AT1]|uniref:MPT63 family protein n=1 Tax=Mycobacterium sp. AT1 TaxID=1961706 RepID=UPI0009AEF671|nr:MPT63 family protein [Mycobacterium sp. AT1]OPX11662.1 phosphopeptide-binding protein [Mycobacterium sp. AT1]